MNPANVNRHSRLPVHRVVAELTRILGAPMVAVLGGAEDTKTVRAWSTGDEAPTHEGALRLGLRTADIILSREAPEVVKAWFAGTDTDLNGRNPLLTIRDHADDAATAKDIVAAAHAFIAI